MRTYARVPDQNGVLRWIQVQTDAAGNNDAVYFWTLIQVLQLNLGESPNFGTLGIPAQQSVMQQVAPDYNMTLIQQQFAQYFLSLTITRVQDTSQPAYNVNVLTHSGVRIQTTVKT